MKRRRHQPRAWRRRHSTGRPLSSASTATKKCCLTSSAAFSTTARARLNAIKAAVDAKDADTIRREAQRLKGVAGNLSASSLFDAAEILERVGAESRLDAADAAWRRLSMAASEVLTTLRQHEYSR